MLAMESTDPIRSLYKHFLSVITLKSLNAFIMPNVLQLSERTLLYQHHALCPRLEPVKDPLPCHPA